MPQASMFMRELETLEAELAMTLAHPAFPVDKCTEFKRRLDSIRNKVGVQAPK